jgi:hypothetical protein
LPTLWFRNTWTGIPDATKPVLAEVNASGVRIVAASHESLGGVFLYCEGEVPLLFTENETNNQRIFGTSNDSPYVKDGINNYLVSRNQDALNTHQRGTKVSAHYELAVGAGKTATIWVRMTNVPPAAIGEPFGSQFASIVQARRQDADEFYRAITPAASASTLLALCARLWPECYGPNSILALM